MTDLPDEQLALYQEVLHILNEQLKKDVCRRYDTHLALVQSVIVQMKLQVVVGVDMEK